jgi:hypothetical protein
MTRYVMVGYVMSDTSQRFGFVSKFLDCFENSGTHLNVFLNFF